MWILTEESSRCTRSAPQLLETFKAANTLGPAQLNDEGGVLRGDLQSLLRDVRSPSSESGVYTHSRASPRLPTSKIRMSRPSMQRFRYSASKQPLAWQQPSDTLRW